MGDFGGNNLFERVNWLDADTQQVQLFRRLLESTKDVVWTSDLQLRFTFISDAITELLGMTPAECLGRAIPDLMVPSSAEYARKMLVKNLAARQTDPGLLKAAFVVEFEFLKRGGEKICTEVRYSYVLDASGLATGLFGITRDITERKQMEETLRKSEQRYRALAETTADIEWEIDAECRYTSISPKVKEVVGCDPEDLLGRTPFDLMAPEEAERVGKVFQKAAVQHATFKNIECAWSHTDGSTRFFEVSGVPIFETGGRFTGYQGTTRDITNRKTR